MYPAKVAVRGIVGGTNFSTLNLALTLNLLVAPAPYFRNELLEQSSHGIGAQSNEVHTDPKAPNFLQKVSDSYPFQPILEELTAPRICLLPYTCAK